MSQLAQRYAIALFDVSEKKATTSTCLEVLSALRTSLLGQTEMLNVLKSPLLSASDKVGILKTAVGSALNDELSEFFNVLAKNDRLHEIPAIALAFEQKVSEARGVLQGTVRSAAELDGTEKERIQKAIETKLNVKVELEYTIDPEMIGGIEARVGSYIFEDNVKSYMTKLNDFITRRVQ